jgi:hypothetical protein
LRNNLEDCHGVSQLPGNAECEHLTIIAIGETLTNVTFNLHVMCHGVFAT